MGKSHAQVIKDFLAGKEHSHGSNFYCEGDTLYSYGSHFPLLIKMPHWSQFGKDGQTYLMNADRYSSSTASHQSSVMRYATLQIPFSALDRAMGILRGDEQYMRRKCLPALNLIALSAPRYDLTGKYTKTTEREIPSKTQFGHTRTRTFRKYERISKAEFDNLSFREQKAWTPEQERRPQSAVLEYMGRYLLPSMDGQNYLISELPRPVKSAEEAFLALKPIEAHDKEYERQGEWFFIGLKVDKAVAKKSYTMMPKNFALPRSGGSSNTHTATRGTVAVLEDEARLLGVAINTILVSGNIRHSTRDHRMLRLSTSKEPKIFAAYRNTAIASWGASGRVD